MKGQSNLNRNVKYICIHCMQFYFDNNITEAQAQVYANFLCEFLNTKIDE